MNLIQITEQLKNPAVSVQQLMQYANNSNPEVPSYVALAEMQRRQSMQAPPQAPKQTVKDQLGAQLMGLPAAPGAPQQPAPGAPQQTAPGAAPPTQQASQPAPEQVPMPAPKQALPNPPGMQPGMAGGGLTSIPLNMHHDFAAGGIIAFADGGYPEEYAMPKDKTDDEIREEREAKELKYGISQDPYSDVKRRYAEIEEKQKASEKDSGYRNVIASLAAMGSGKPRRFGEAMATYAETATNLEKEQQKLSEQNAMKMAELQTAFAERDDARRRGNLADDRAAQDKISNLKKEMLGLRTQYTNAEANKAQSGATVKNAETNAAKELREAETEKIMRPLDVKYKNALISQAGRPPAEIQLAEKYWKSMPPGTTFQQAYDTMMSGKGGSKGKLTYEEAYKQAATLNPGSSPKEIAAIAHEMIRYENPNALNPTAAPPVGTVKGGYRFKGGDPGKQENWERV